MLSAISPISFKSAPGRLSFLKKYTSDIFVRTPKTTETVYPKYPELYSIDNDYKKALLKGLGITGVSLLSLTSILGPAAFKSFIEKHSEDAEFYSPGTRPDDKKGINDSYPLTNVENRKFGANLHIHTTDSDGKLTVQELLDQAAKYGNKYAKKNKEPFTIAITDHNTAEGCKKAIQILAENPKKYKNLRVVLGSEISVKEDEVYGYKFRKPEKFHILTMCINPFEEQFNNFIKDIHQGKKGVMNPRTIRLSEVVSMTEAQPNVFLCYAHPAWPDLTHRIKNPEDDYCELSKKCIKFFSEQAGDKALYAEQYYGGYEGSLATDEKLHNAIREAISETGLKKAGGLDTHGNSVFYNGQTISR